MSRVPAIGALRRRLQLLAPEDVPDGMGGATRTLAPAGHAWGRVVTVRRREAVETGRTTGLLTHRVTVRCGTPVVSGMVILDGARRYRVLAVEPADPARRFLDLLSEEETP